jgi:hypothetical protein
MATYIKDDTLRSVVYGHQIVKTAVAFPQTATANLFTVSVGNVMVTSLCAVLTTATTTDPQITLGTAPTTGTAETNGLATTTALTSQEVGTWLGVLETTTTDKPGALVVGAHAGNVIFPAVSFAAAPGYITITTAASQAGAATWYLTYVPLDNGAYVS